MHARNKNNPDRCFYDAFLAAGGEPKAAPTDDYGSGVPPCSRLLEQIAKLWETRALPAALRLPQHFFLRMNRNGEHPGIRTYLSALVQPFWETWFSAKAASSATSITVPRMFTGYGDGAHIPTIVPREFATFFETACKLQHLNLSGHSEIKAEHALAIAQALHLGQLGHTLRTLDLGVTSHGQWSHYVVSTFIGTCSITAMIVIYL